ncbi:MAG: hypothetical protein ACT6FF_05500 [Methanosarcinaceae archaeon]
MFDQFKQDLLLKKLNNEQIFQKYFIDQKTYFFFSNHNEEYLLKCEIAEVLKVYINDIYIIGSGKVGFSIKPKAIGRAFDENFKKTHKLNDKSDIDVAIVSNELFEFIMVNMYDWSEAYKKDWNSNDYYSDGKEKFGVSLKYKFLEYMGKGWYRPDFTPVSYSLERGESSIQDAIKSWRKRLKRKVSIAIYKNWNFFMKYQIENIQSIRDGLSSGDLL